jgi:predicted RNA-binding Zn-ribbon protein involved in translation (DUF1610 family)
MRGTIDKMIEKIEKKKELKKCKCGTKIRWQKSYLELETKCNCGAENYRSEINWKDEVQRECEQCGWRSGYQYEGIVFRVLCQGCGKKTEWHRKKSRARDEWNEVTAGKAKTMNSELFENI